MSEVLPALSWSLVHFVWIGACAALLLRGALELMRARSSQGRYLLSMLGLLALPVVFAVNLAGELAVRPPVVLVGGAWAPNVSQPGRADAFRAWLASGLTPLERWLVLAWILGVVFFGVRLIGAWVWCRRFTRVHAHAAPPRWQARLARISRRVGLRRRARLYFSSRVDVPMVLGGAQPAIVVPRSLLRGLSLRDFDALLAHELAHVRRLDGALNLLQVLVETLFFFHPAVWWISRQARAEREHCCDEAALAACRSPLVLARALTRLEEQRCHRGASAAPALALAATDGCLTGRIERLLGIQARSSRRLSAAALGLVGVSGLALGAVPTRPPGPLIELLHAPAHAIELELGVEGWVGSLAPDVDLMLEHGDQHVFAVSNVDDFVFEPGQGQVFALKFVAGSADSEDLRVLLERQHRASNLATGKALRVRRAFRMVVAEDG
jgi:beta-lactamase regulating signal transducer with metallopeptidase domain